MTAAVLDLHIGAHKTATTHIQAILDGSEFQPGTRNIPRSKFKIDVTRDLNANKLKAFPDYMQEEAHLIISDENLSGIKPGDGLNMYRRIGKNMSYFSEFSGRVHLCVRNYVEFFPSTWIQGTRFGLSTPFPKDDQPRSWVDVLRDVEENLPNFQIEVWDYDDFKKDVNFYVKHISNNSIKGEPVSPNGVTHPSPSATALDAFLASAEFLDRRRRNIVLDRLIKLFPISDENGKFQPYSDAEKRALDARYQRELEVIEARYGLVRPA